MTPTCYAKLCRWQAALLLIATALAIGWCIAVALAPDPPGGPPVAGGQDLGVYRRIAERVHSGESYYQAAGDELRPAGYPTGSVFNWRTPTYAWLFGLLPAVRWAQGLLVMLCAGTLLSAFTVLERAGGRKRAAGGVLAMLGAFLWCIDGEAYLAQELWAGVLITLSVCGYLLGSWPLGVSAGLAALFFRELALPYCLITAGFAVRKHCRRELIVWAIGLTAYALFLAWHFHEVMQQIRPEDRLPGSWVQFGGTRFILATNRMNVFLFSAPRWIGAIYLPLALLGLGSWGGNAGWRLRLTVGAYLAAFAVVGQPFNEYWGLLYAPILAFGIAWAPAALVDLWRVVRGSTSAQASLPGVQ